MKQLPCEKAIWETIPVIRKEITCCMVRDFNLTQREAASLIGITPAAVSQYRCNKRARKEINDLSILNEIRKSTEIIIRNKGNDLSFELCRLCRLMTKDVVCKY
jgi:predicted transcriptional regulator